MRWNRLYERGRIFQELIPLPENKDSRGCGCLAWVIVIGLLIWLGATILSAICPLVVGLVAAGFICWIIYAIIH